MKKYIFLFIGIIGLVSFTGAQTWQAPQRLTWDSIHSSNPVIAVGTGNDMHIAWTSMFSGGNREIYYKKSTDSGSSWMVSKRLTWSSRSFSGHDITVDGLNRVHIVFSDPLVGNSDLFYKRSTDGGTTWDPLKRMTWTSGFKMISCVAFDSFNNIYVVWSDSTPGNAELFLKKSTDGGTSWSPPKRLTWTSGYNWELSLKTSSANTLHIAYTDDTSGYLDVYYKSSIDGGSSWNSPRRVTWGANEAEAVDLAIDSGGHINIVWADELVPDTEIFFKKSTNGGTSWSALQRITWNSGSSYGPDIDINSSDVYNLVWYDYSPGRGEVFHKKSTDNGASWGPINRLTWSVYDSVASSLVSQANNRLHLTWEERLSDDYEIFYKRSNLFVMEINH